MWLIIVTIVLGWSATLSSPAHIGNKKMTQMFDDSHGISKRFATNDENKISQDTGHRALLANVGSPSDDGQPCVSKLQCKSLACFTGKCQPASCNDGVKNQDETDTDCGGMNCKPCVNRRICSRPSDCISGVCKLTLCQIPTCGDGVKNQDESDKDCGGAKCGKCGNAKRCNDLSDCVSGECRSNVCTKCSFNAFVNGNFESGTSNGWILGGGNRDSVASSTIIPNDYKPNGPGYDANTANSHSTIVTPGYDPIFGTLMPNIVHSGNYSWRVEDLDSGAYLSVISQRVNSYFCTDIYFTWLAVLQNGGHDAEVSSLIVIELKDLTVGDTLLSRRYNAGAGGGSVDSRFQELNGYFFTPAWQIEHLSIDGNRTGHDFEINILAADCAWGGHIGYVYLDSFGGTAV